MEGASPLSQLTSGVHLHTLRCPDENALRHLKEQLRKLDMLAE